MAGPTEESSLADIVRQLRHGQHMTREELRDASGISVQAIGDIERGKTLTPHRATIDELAKALACDERHTAALHAVARRNARLGEVRRPGGDDPARRGDVAQTLPRDIPSFTGREEELRQLAADAAAAAPTGGVVAVTVIEGMAGVGKTSLALHAARLLAEQFPDGQIFIDLHGYTEGVQPLAAEAALASLLLTLGVRPGHIPKNPEDRAAAFRRRLASTRTLIILDNAASAAQIRPLLPGNSGSMVIVTSRKNLTGLDDASVIGLGVPPRDEAIALFRAVAGVARIPAYSRELAEIVQLCGRLPLAIRIVASRMSHRPALTVAELAARLRDEHRLLAFLADDARSVASAIEMSFRHLPEPERRLFRLLGLIPGPDVDTLAVANLADIKPSSVRRGLDALVDHNLLLDGLPGRYRLHDLVRAYARGLGSPSEDAPPADRPGYDPGTASKEAPAAISRLLDFYLYSAQQADTRFEQRTLRSSPADVPTPRAAPTLDTAEHAQAWLAAEIENLDAAISYAADNKPGHAIALADALAHYLRAHGPWPRAIAMHEAALRAATVSGDHAGQAGALTNLGIIRRQQGDLAGAETDLRNAISVYDAQQNPHGHASVLVELGIVQRLLGDPASAESSLVDAIESYSAFGDTRGRAQALAELANVQRHLGNFSAAETSLTEARALYVTIGNRQGEAAACVYVGSVQAARGALGPAAESLARGQHVFGELDEPIGQANCLLVLGDVQRKAGQLTDAQRSLQKALRLYRSLGDARSQAGALAFLGAAQLQAGANRLAERHLYQALSLFRKLRDRGGEAETLNYCARLAAANGNRERALDLHNQALQLARAISSGKDEADALAGLAAIYQLNENVAMARSTFSEALARYLSCNCPDDAARVMQALNAMP